MRSKSVDRSLKIFENKMQRQTHGYTSLYFLRFERPACAERLQQTAPCSVFFSESSTKSLAVEGGHSERRVEIDRLDCERPYGTSSRPKSKRIAEMSALFCARSSLWKFSRNFLAQSKRSSGKLCPSPEVGTPVLQNLRCLRISCSISTTRFLEVTCPR
jgi:hypothetical protein